MQANYANALCHLNATPLNKAKTGAVFGRGTSLSLSLSLSLSRCLRFLTRLWAKFKGLFTHFVVVFSYFIVVFSHLFTCKRHFLGYFVFLKFLNALFLGFLRLSLRAVCLKTADFVILSLLQKGEKSTL